MKRFLLWFALALGVCAGVIALTATRYEPRVRTGTFAGPVSLGDLTRDEAARKLRIWWEAEKVRSLDVTASGVVAKPVTLSIDSLGVRLDDEATVAQLPVEGAWARLKRQLSGNVPSKQEFDVRFTWSEDGIKRFESLISASMGPRRPARVRWVSGAIERLPEVAKFELDREALDRAFSLALEQTGILELPVAQRGKEVPDEELAKITGVIAEFHTSFPKYQVSRNANIKLAAQKIDGAVLMPGQEFSFNKTVGRRTIEEGYRLAGVYRNGRHDVGIGGGICQVSGTLYNAALLANLKIIQRQNHSMPVPYVPIGRDATVDYGKIDLRFRNDSDTPVAISSEFVSGRLTFRVLGVPDPSMQVRILTSGHRSWGRGEKVVHDGSLPPGKSKVIEKGSAGHAVNVFRVVYRDGQEVSRESLGQSRYGGGVRIVARNLKTQAVKPGADVDGIGDSLPPVPPDE